MQGANSFTVVASGTSVGSAVEGAIGSEIGIARYDTITLWVDYTNGDETAIYIYPKFYHESGGTGYQWQDWSAAIGDKTVTTNRLQMTATGNYYAVFDVNGIGFVKFFSIVPDGTPTGTMGVYATLSAKRS